MAQVLDKQGLQHYANKMCNADNRKVGSKSLPTALNDIDTAINGFKTLFESEYGTPVNMELENNENVFSIGTGTNIDKKDDVENSFTDVEIKGTTLVNIYGKGFSDVANIGNGSGEIVDDGYYKLVANGSFRNAFLQKGKFPMKPSTVYTVIMFVRKETLVGSKLFMLSDGTSDSPFQDSSIDLNGIGTYTKKVTTLSDFDSTDFCFRGYILPQATSGELEFKVMLLEGDWTNKPIPQHFEGLKSVGEKEDGNHKISISSVGKNLFEPTVSQKSSSITANTQYSIENNGYSISISSSVNRPTTETASHIHFGEVKLKIGETYVVSADKIIKDTNTAIPQIRIAYWDKQNNRYATIGYLTNHTSVFTFTVESGKEYVALGLYSHGALLTNGQTVKATYEGVRLYLKSTSNTSYEPHKSDKKEISLNEPLRGLPNGIKDTIEKINGEWKIVRRCGEIIFDGVTNRITDYHPSWSSGDYHAGYSNALKNIRKKGDTIGIADKIVVTTVEKILAGTNIAQNKGLWLENYSYVVYFSIPKNEATGESISAINTWLTNNNVKLIYQLETPTIEDISPVTLQCWKNGTISIDEVLPVESTHTVALNKSAQIQKNIEELTLLRNRVETLEKQYNNSTLNQAYELELLRFDMELNNIV